MIYPIFTYGQPVLRQVAQDIDKDYPELEKLIDDMFETMYNSQGVGLAAPQVGGVVRLTRFIFKTAFLIEILGALALLPIFCKRYGLEGIWMSVFHSISAFCNAGFDLMGTKTGHFSSLTSFSDSIYATVIF